jgi:hypothetical protein
MEVYISIVSRRTQLTFTDRQHAFLVDESLRSGRSMAEIVRRLVDAHLRAGARWTLRGYEFEAGVRRTPDRHAAGPRPTKPRTLDARD